MIKEIFLNSETSQHYLLKDRNRNIRTMFEICSKLVALTKSIEEIIVKSVPSPHLLVQNQQQ